jgi:hypothetical protein
MPTITAVAEALSPERQALSDAIERLRQYDAAISELRENDNVRTSYLYECNAAVPAAEDALRETMAGLKVDYQTAKWSKDWVWEPEPTEPLHLVEALATARRREVEAGAAREGIRTELRSAELRRKDLAEAVDRAAWIVQAAHAEDIGLADETERLQRAAYDLGLKLMLLHNAGLIATKRKGTYGDEPLPVMKTLGRVRAYETFWDLDDLEGGRSWTAAHDRLMSDPTAEIP